MNGPPTRKPDGNLLLLVTPAISSCEGWLGLNHAMSGFMGLGVTILMSASILVAYDVFRGPGPAPPGAYAFSQGSEAGTILVIAAPHGIYWDQLAVNGCANVPSGIVTGGQVIAGCQGMVTITQRASNQILFSRNV